MLLLESHKKLLREIAKHPVSRKDPREIEDLQYLYNLGLIVVVSFPSEDDYYFEGNRLTEQGKAYLESLRSENVRNRRNSISFYIAIAAFLLSVLIYTIP